MAKEKPLGRTRTGTTFAELELHLAVLQICSELKPVFTKTILEILDLEDTALLDRTINDLQEHGYLRRAENRFITTPAGKNYIAEQLKECSEDS